MIVGVPKEIKTNESRVALTPHGASDLIRSNHTVLVEKNAGVLSGYADKEYLDNGCTICATAQEVFDQSELIVKVKEPQPTEVAMIRSDHTVFTYFHFAASEDLTQSFLSTGASAIAYETITSDNGSLPLLVPMSEVAGRMAVQEGAKYLEKTLGGRGILLGGVPGVEPATVTIIGGGIVGTNAAYIASGLGANVYILDNNLSRLRYLDEIMPKNVNTIFSNHHNISQLLTKTDLLVGAVLIPGARAPHLVTRSMLKLMPPGAVIVDVAVDQGGCVETCKPTTHENPTFDVDGIIHYCVANMPGAVPFTSTIALTNATSPYLTKLANLGVKEALNSDRHLLNGLNTYRGKITHRGVAEAFGLDYVEPASVLA
ncbi:MAG: alanine dehydrogenase [FCB group bacterium]|nr:alanine dehydrogenase [FCB group bacterium]